eukprot:2136035-Pyramimonas_sp.AAC.1
MGMKYASAIYSSSLLLRTGGYFLRLILAVRLLVQEKFVSLGAAPCESDLQLCKDFLDLAWSTKSCKLEAEGFASRRRAAVCAAQKKEFLDVFNGGFKRWRLSSLYHYCTGPDCCRSEAHTRERMAQVIIRIILGHRPTVPSLNRWTLIGPAIDFHLLGMVHNILPQLYAVGFCNLESELIKAATDLEEQRQAGAAAGVDDQIVSEWHWHAAAGKRLRDVKDVFGSVTFFLNLYVFAAVLHPIFRITHWLISRSKDVVDEGQGPPILDWLYAPSSPVVASGVHFSQTLAAATAVSRTIVCLSGYVSYQEFCTDRELVLRIRGYFVCAAAWIYYRHWRRTKQWPWRLAILVDERPIGLNRNDHRPW